MLEVGAFHPAWGDIHLGPENALEALALLGGGAFLPVHWGTFSLAMYAWDQPAETLLDLAPRRGVHLVMPQLGQPVEPAQVDSVLPWWRGVDAGAGGGVPPQRVSWPRAAARPIDDRRVRRHPLRLSCRAASAQRRRVKLCKCAAAAAPAGRRPRPGGRSGRST